MLQSSTTIDWSIRQITMQELVNVQNPFVPLIIWVQNDYVQSLVLKFLYTQYALCSRFLNKLFDIYNISQILGWNRKKNSKIRRLY
jgi:hypothetical protein